MDDQVIAVVARLSGESWYEDVTDENPDIRVLRYLIIDASGHAFHVDMSGKRYSGANGYFDKHRDAYIQILPPTFPKDK